MYRKIKDTFVTLSCYNIEVNLPLSLWLSVSFRRARDAHSLVLTQWSKVRGRLSAINVEVRLVVQVGPRVESPPRELQTEQVSHFIQMVQHLVQHLSGVRGRQTEASSGLSNGSRRETHHHHADPPLQHLPRKGNHFAGHVEQDGNHR